MKDRRIKLGTINLTEHQIQADGVKFLRRIGCHVKVTSDRRRAVSNGVPDVLCWPPNGRPFFFWEAKSSSGKLSPEQMEVGAWCRESQTGWISGGLTELHGHLQRIGVLPADTSVVAP